MILFSSNTCIEEMLPMRHHEALHSFLIPYEQRSLFLFNAVMSNQHGIHKYSTGMLLALYLVSCCFASGVLLEVMLNHFHRL